MLSGRIHHARQMPTSTGLRILSVLLRTRRTQIQGVMHWARIANTLPDKRADCAVASVAGVVRVIQGCLSLCRTCYALLAFLQ